jgi:hypothetical protein
MALQLSHTTNQNVSANYWRIDFYQYNKVSDKWHVTLGLYKDSSSAASNQPLERREYFIDAAAEATLKTSNKSSLTELYAAIKLLDDPIDFTSATDV